MAVPNRILQFKDSQESRERTLAVYQQALKKHRAGSVRVHDVREPPPGSAPSESGTKIAFSELDAELQALITSGSGGGNLRVRELDGSPDVQPVDDIRVPNGSIVSVGGSTIQFLFADYAGSFELADPGPGTGDIPAGRWAWWYDTTNNRQFLVRNRGGSLFYVELTC